MLRPTDAAIPENGPISPIFTIPPPWAWFPWPPPPVPPVAPPFDTQAEATSTRIAKAAERMPSRNAWTIQHPPGVLRPPGTDRHFLSTPGTPKRENPARAREAYQRISHSYTPNLHDMS